MPGELSETQVRWVVQGLPDQSHAKNVAILESAAACFGNSDHESIYKIVVVVESVDMLITDLKR